MQEWTSDTLFNKGKLYLERAFDQDRTSDLFPIYSALALEFLSRAALASIHPALLASPGEGENILYAFGYPATATPVSIPTATVYRRLKYVVKDFSDDDLSLCQKLAGLRNQELHTGSLAFAAFSTSEWLPGFYRVLKKILGQLGRDFKDVLSGAEAKHANELIAEAASSVKKAVDEKIGRLVSKMSVLKPEELEERRKKNDPKFVFARHVSGIGIAARGCPACKSKGILVAKPIGATPPRLKDGEIVSQSIYWPAKFECKVCGLNLDGFEELKVAKLADEIVQEDSLDPVEFFEINVEEYITDEMIREAAHPEEYGNE